jgi:hypothetical protein
MGRLTQEQLEAKIQERPSSMDRALLCPGSLYPQPGEPLIETVGDDAAPIGQAAHEVFKAIAMDEDYNLEELALKHGIKTSDLDYLKYTAYRSVETLAEQFDVEKWVAEEKQISIEVKGLDIHLEGTPDLIGITRDGKTLIVVDYKTGRSTASHKNQIMSYGHISLSQHPEIEKVVGVIIWARDLEFQVWTWSREELDVWVREANGIIYRWDGVSYAVGEHCTFCRRSSCPARVAKLRELVPMVAEAEDEDSLVPAGASLQDMYNFARSMPKSIENWLKRLKEEIKRTGDLDLGNDKVLTLKEKNGASVIDTMTAAVLLEDDFLFTPDEVLALCKMSKTALENEIGNRAAKGCKGRDKKEVIEALKEADAIFQPKLNVLAVVDKPKGEIDGK